MAYTPSANSDLQFTGSYTSSNNSDLQFESDVVIPLLEGDAYTGETLNSLDLQALVQFEVDNYVGQVAHIDGLVVPIYLEGDAYTGEYSDADLSVFPGAELETDNYTGESLEFDLSVEYALDVFNYTGQIATITDGGPHSINPLEYFNYESGDSSYSATSTCLTLESVISAGNDEGINVALDLPFALGETLSFKFKYTRPSASDDFSLSFWIFPGWKFSEVYYHSGSDNYDSPRFTTADGTVNDQAVWVEINHLSGTSVFNWYQDGSTKVSQSLTNHSSFSADDLNGTNEIELRISNQRTSDGQTVIEWYSGVSLKQRTFVSGDPDLWDHIRATTNNLFLVHYHNNLANEDATLCDISIESSLDGFIITDFIELETDNYTGQTLEELDLITSVTFDSDNYAGETLDVDVEFHPRAFLETDNYTGESLEELDLVISVTFDSDNYTGEYADTDFTIFPSEGMGEFEGYTGEVLDADLSIQVRFPVDNYAGQYADADFYVPPRAEIDSDAYSGEYVDADLRTDDALDVLNFTGQYADADLSNFPGAELDADAYSGEVLEELNLSTETTLVPRVYVGEYADADLTDFPSPGIEDVNTYAGQYADAELFFDFGLDPLDAYTGEHGEVVTIEEEPHIWIYTGETASFELATTPVFSDVDCYAGQTTSAILTLPPRAFMSAYAHHGQVAYTPLEALRTPYLEVIFWGSIWTHFDYRSQTYFDLSTNEACCYAVVPPPGAQLYFELMKEDVPETQAGGSGQFFFAELSTLARLEADAYTGEYSEFVETVDYLEVTFDHGTHNLDFAFDADLRHRLCKGYFIPNGYWMVVELTDLLDEDCYADRMYGGEVLYVSMSFNEQLLLESPSNGQKLDAVLTVEQPLLFQAFAGSLLKLDFILEFDSYSGSEMTFEFFEESYEIQVGATMDFELTIEYFARFTEEGCFDNELVWQDEEGDQIPEMFQEVPVEGDPYTHSVRGECY